VAMNIAMTLKRFGLTPSLLTAIGHDEEGFELMAACEALGLITEHVHRDADLPTDIYMAGEGAGGLIAAIADAHSLKAAGDAILAPLEDGRLGHARAPFAGILALDGNLTEALLADIAGRESFRAADLRLAPASPGKATRLVPLMAHPGVTLYVNREEAGLLTGTQPGNAIEAAEALLAAGAVRVLVTDGGNGAAEGAKGGVTHAPAPKVTVTRITGAGDTFMAAHIAAEARGAEPHEALPAALKAAARYVSEENHAI
ncbi:MAG: carbohydrate kinase family protein, partial [Rhodobacteraceae bacterium]|nr:carbohydrate kinase family protein [Paracoccaceae bacterium]